MAPRYSSSYCRDSGDTFINGMGSLDEVGVEESDVSSRTLIPTPLTTVVLSSHLLFGIPVELDGRFPSCWNALFSSVVAEALMDVPTLCLRRDQDYHPQSLMRNWELAEEAARPHSRRNLIRKDSEANNPNWLISTPPCSSCRQGLAAMQPTMFHILIALDNSLFLRIVGAKIVKDAWNMLRKPAKEMTKSKLSR